MVPHIDLSDIRRAVPLTGLCLLLYGLICEASGSDSASPFVLRSDECINILLVDDEPRNLTVLETILSDPVYRLVRAESADEALLALVREEFAFWDESRVLLTNNSVK